MTVPIAVDNGPSSSLESSRGGNAPCVALPPALDLPHIPPCPPPKIRLLRPSLPRPSLPRPSPRPRDPDLQPLDEHLAELLNPALAEPKARLRRSAAAEVRGPRAGKPSARPDRGRGLGRFAQGAAGGGRPQHPQPPAVGAASAAAAGQVRGRAARSASSPNSSRRATSRRRSRSWSRACAHRSATRCCSASPARARPSPWPR